MSGSSVLEATMQQLEDGIKALYESDAYKKYLDTMAKFHRYSVNNNILIAMQKPEATLVAGYTAWRDTFHRQVKKGEKGIRIIAPVKQMQEKPIFKDGKPQFDEKGNLITEKVKTHGFKASTVFDISQTEGDPLPAIVSELKDPVDGFDDYLDAIKKISPVPIRFDDIPGSAHGYYSPERKEIVIQRGMAEEQTLKTMIHECAHARLDHGGKDDHWDRNTHEVQAESIAYVCSKALGFDTSDYSFGYIAGWSSNKEMKEFKESLHVIRDNADKMISGVEEEMTRVMEIRKERQKETLEIKTKTIKMAM